MLTTKSFDWPIPTLRPAPSRTDKRASGPGPLPPHRLLATLVRWADRFATAHAVGSLDEHLRRDIGLSVPPQPDGRARLARLRCAAHGGRPYPFGQD